MSELHFDLRKTRCPRCAGELVVRLQVAEVADDVRVVVDSACASCGVTPWPDSDERLLVFRPGRATGGASGGSAEDLASRLAAAQARIEQLVRRVDGLDHDLEAARRQLARAEEEGRRRQGEVVVSLRAEVSRLEGELAQARVEVRRSEEATRGEVKPGKRPIEID